MYFVTPSNPNIFLIGIHETQIYGFGEKDGKLCIYSKLIFDSGDWKEFYLTDIVVVKSDCCESGIHVATGLGIKEKAIKIWIAARDNTFTRIASLDIDTKKFIRYKMLHEIYSEFALLNLNLCSTCVKPIIRYPDQYLNFTSLVIVPQKYQKTIGVFHIRVSINPSNHCLLWKKNDSFTLNSPPTAASSNILVNVDALEALSVIRRSEEENGRIQNLSIEYDGTQIGINMRNEDDNEIIWHEVAFCNGLCLSRQRQEDGKSILNLSAVGFFQDGNPISIPYIDYCTVDVYFPSIDSANFFVAWRIVDEEYVTKTNRKAFNVAIQSYVVPSFIVAQTAAGIVVIPLRILSLSEAAYLSHARIPRPLTTMSPLPVEQPSCFYYCIQRIRKLFGLKENVSRKEEDAPWMSIEFIKQKIGWPNILPLTNAPKLPMINSK